MLNLLVTGCAAAGCRNLGLVGAQLLLLIGGVVGRAVVGGGVSTQAAAAEARQAPDVLLAASR